MKDTTNTFNYWGTEAKGYSEYKGTTTNYKGESLYMYSFVIVDIHTGKLLYSLPYTGTVAPF